MMIKGYVVRGVSEFGGTFASRYTDLDEATGYRVERLLRGATEAIIFAVAEDGTETPLPTYEEALAAVDKAAMELAVERGLRETAERMCKRMQDERNATYAAHALGKLADELDEDNHARAATALREAIFMLDKAAQRDAAWARLVKAERAPASYEAADELLLALQALRDLGADVDALLSD